MSAQADWTEILKLGVAQRPNPVVAETYLREWGSASHPVLLECNDGQTYVVKGQQAGRMIANDQVVAALGCQMSAPVPAPALVDVPPELIAVQPEMQHLAPGVSHGSTFVPDCSNDREDLAHTGGENNGRFARLSVLYGWIHASDHQFIYGNADPRLVYSVDHGHFFPNGPNWTEASLQSAGHAEFDSKIDGSVSWDDSQLNEVRTSVAGISDELIARAVARPPNHWGLSTPERRAMAAYLSRRRDEMLIRIDGRMTSA